MKDGLLTKYVRFSIRDDGILEAEFLPQFRKIDLAMAVGIVADRLRFQRGKEMAVLVKPGWGLQIDQQARDYFSGSEGIRGLIATAMLLEKGDYFNFALATFMARVHRPAMPTKIYLNEVRAVRWLRDEIKKPRIHET